jgi:hypothetical protein
VAEILREVDRRRSALAELALDEIPILQRIAETSENGVGQSTLLLRRRRLKEDRL